MLKYKFTYGFPLNQSVSPQTLCIQIYHNMNRAIKNEKGGKSDY